MFLSGVINAALKFVSGGVKSVVGAGKTAIKTAATTYVQDQAAQLEAVQKAGQAAGEAAAKATFQKYALWAGGAVLALFVVMFGFVLVSRK